MEKENLRDIIIKIILIIIIILLIFNNYMLIKTLNNKKNTPKMQPGNVDVFQICCDKNSNCNNDGKKDSSIPTANNIDDFDDNIPSDEDEEKKDDENNDFTVLDNNIVWESTNELRIFSNPVYNMDSKIAPGDSNAYNFVVKNNTEYNVKYSIKFSEMNPYNMNMRYRLKKANSYIAGTDGYVEYNMLDQIDVTLKSGESNNYYLEWKWIGTNNDNHLSGIDSAYSIKIEIEAYSIDE